MDKFKYIKSIIGNLVGYYRKEAGISVDDFLIDTGSHYEELCLNCNKCLDSTIICSRATFYRFEKGNIVNNECIYHRVAHKLNKQVILENYSIYKTIENYRSLLIHLLIDFSKSKLEKLSAEINYSLIKYKNVLYVEEILNLYNDIILCVLYKKTISYQKGDIYKYLLDIVKEEDKKLITFLFYKDHFKCIKIPFTMDTINDMCSKYYNDLLFFEPMLYNLTSKDSFTAYNYVLSIKDSKKDELTFYHKYLLNREIGHIQLDLGSYEQSYDTLFNCHDLLNKFDSNVSLLKLNYQDMGKICHLLKKYHEAIEWFMKARELVESKSIGPDYLFLFHALEKTNNMNQINHLLETIDMTKMKDKYGKKIVIYYKMKYTKNKNDILKSVELENYILELLPTLKQYGTIHEDVFDLELKELVSVTGNYKKYYIFNS